MQSISARVDDETHTELERRANDRGSSISQVTRDVIDKGLEYDELKAERDRLERQLAATNRRVDEHQELVEYVEREKELHRRRKERLDAPVWKRAKWWVLGASGSRGGGAERSHDDTAPRADGSDWVGAADG